MSIPPFPNIQYRFLAQLEEGNCAASPNPSHLTLQEAGLTAQEALVCIDAVRLLKHVGVISNSQFFLGISDDGCSFGKPYCRPSWSGILHHRACWWRADGTNPVFQLFWLTSYSRLLVLFFARLMVWRCTIVISHRKSRVSWMRGEVLRRFCRMLMTPDCIDFYFLDSPRSSSWSRCLNSRPSDWGKPLCNWWWSLWFPRHVNPCDASSTCCSLAFISIILLVNLLLGWPCLSHWFDSWVEGPILVPPRRRFLCQRWWWKVPPGNPLSWYNYPLVSIMHFISVH